MKPAVTQGREKQMEREISWSQVYGCFSRGRVDERGEMIQMKKLEEALIGKGLGLSEEFFYSIKMSEHCRY